MGDAALGACAEMDSIRLVLPNRHHLLVDLTPLGLDNPNEIFVATAEPYGRIEAVIGRGG
jgi:urate oxidase